MVRFSVHALIHWMGYVQLQNVIFFMYLMEEPPSLQPDPPPKVRVVTKRSVTLSAQQTNSFCSIYGILNIVNIRCFKFLYCNNSLGGVSKDTRMHSERILGDSTRKSERSGVQGRGASVLQFATF